MPPSSNTAKLKELMTLHRLDPLSVGKLLNRSEQTVREWRCNNKNNIPDAMLELLQFKLAQSEGKV